MKKTVLIALSALFTIAACQKAPVAQNEEQTEVKEIIFKISVNHSDDTKAVKTGWADGDKVYVFFEGKDLTGVKYVTLTRSGSDWGATLTGMTASELAIANPANMYAVFFPYEQPVIASDGSTGVTFKTDNHAPHYAATAGLSIYTYYMTANSTCSVTVDGETAILTGTLNMAIPDGYVQFFINTNSTNYNEDYRYRLSVQGVKPTACVSYSGGTFGTKELNDAQPMWGYKHGDDGVAFSGVIDGTWASAADHIIYLFDTNAAAKSFTISAISGKTLSSHNTVNFSTNHPSSWAAAAAADNSPIACGETLWARFNLGATAAGTAPENYGWYFQWGNIVPARSTTVAPYTGFGTETKYKNTIAYEALYNKDQNLTGVYAIYDMATAFLGSPWRLPTAGTNERETRALTNAGTEWSGNHIITNTTQGESVNYITFPAAGFWNAGRYVNGNVNGAVWSSWNHVSNKDNAYCFNWDHTDLPSYSGIYPNSGNARWLAVSIRPVQDAE